MFLETGAKLLGRVLSPLHLFIFTNDFRAASNIRILKYADDTIMIGLT